MWSFLIFFCALLSARGAEGDAVSEQGLTFLPAVYYTPDTSAALGGSVIWHHRADVQERWKTSVVRTALIYTLNDQWIAQFAPEVYLPGGKIFLRAGLSWLDYPEKFYGIGSAADGVEETYASQSFRFRLNPALELGERNWLGLVYEGSWVRLSEAVKGGEVEKLLMTLGDHQHFNGVGVTFRRDLRDSTFYPTQGMFFEAAAVRYEPSLLANDFRFSRFHADARAYRTLDEQNVAGIQAMLTGIDGSVPFNQYPSIGGGRSLRGYREARYRGQWALLAQGELRHRYSGKIGSVAFAGLGTLFGKEEEYQRLFPCAGAGFRYLLNPKELIHARIDLAWSPGNFGFYVLIGEAF